MLLQFLCTLLPTLLIEGVLLLAFGYRSRRSLLVFLLVNLVTQGGFALYLAVTVLNHGVSGWSLLFYIPIELIITASRAAVLDRRLLTEKGRGTRGGLRRRRKCLLRDGGACCSSTRCGGSSSAFLTNYYAPRTGAETKGNYFHGDRKAVLCRPLSDGI